MGAVGKFLACLQERWPELHDQLPAALKVAEWRCLESGEFLFHEGDPGGCLYFLGSGRFRVFRAQQESRTLSWEEAGAILGELGALDRQPRTASARAARRSWVACLELTPSSLAQAEVLQLLVKVMAVRYRAAMEREQAYLHQLQQMNRELELTAQRVRRQAERESRKLERENATLLLKNRQDPLTRVWNRQYFDEQMHFWSQSQEGMGLAMFDLDHFKAVNDNHGHQAGDRVLVEFSGLLQKMAVRSERVVRFGGEEFVVLMPGADLKRSHRRAEKMRQAVADHPFPLRGSASLTTSVGVAAATPLRDPSALVAAADQALYRAKASGRNRVEIATG